MGMRKGLRVQRGLEEMEGVAKGYLIKTSAEGRRMSSSSLDEGYNPVQ